MQVLHQTPQTLAYLLESIVICPAAIADLTIIGLCSDSREVNCGDLFIAYAGPMAERDAFIEQAILKGAAAILLQASTDTPAFGMKAAEDGRLIPMLAIPQLNTQVGLIAARFYQHPARQLTLIGITGTNGKTSCSQFIAHVLDQVGDRCGIIGTLGEGFPDHITPGSLTTPGAITLQRSLANLKARGATRVAMEVSSHSLVQHRVAGISFAIAVFTNLTRDHLDYHGDMSQYGQAKRLLFLSPGLKQAVINLDDAFGKQLLREFTASLDCYTYGIETDTAYVPMVRADNLQLHAHGLSAHIVSPWGEGQLASKMLGRFNLSNLLAALTTLCLLGMPFDQALTKLSALPTVPGRMQCFGGNQRPLVVVDYAHTPDALEKALSALREHSQQTIWCVFGCGGNRDTGKRALMAKVAEAHSDRIIVTNDNPRFENPRSIIDAILTGFSNPHAVMVEPDRKAAIAYAILHAQPGDMVLIAGKGHETYQQIGEQKLTFSDVAEVEANLRMPPCCHPTVCP